MKSGRLLERSKRMFPTNARVNLNLVSATFIHDPASRLSHQVQLTTDGHKLYLEAVESAFGGETDYATDYAMLIKLYAYGGTMSSIVRLNVNYLSYICIGAKKKVVTDHPCGRDVSTRSALLKDRILYLDHAYRNKTFHASNEQIQQKGGEPCSRDCLAL